MRWSKQTTLALTRELSDVIQRRKMCEAKANKRRKPDEVVAG